MSRSLSSIIREYEQLKGGRLPEVRRWHNFLLRGGQITTCEVTIKGQPVTFDVNSMFITQTRSHMNPKYNDPKLVLGWLICNHRMSCEPFIKKVIESVSFFTEKYKNDIGIIRNEDPLHLGDVQYFAVAYKDMNTWIPFISKNIDLFHFNEMNLVNSRVRNLEIFRSILGHFPCHRRVIEMYKKLTARARSILAKLTTRRRVSKYKDRVEPYLEYVTETISHLRDAPQELLDLQTTLSEIHTCEPPNETLPNTETSSSSKRKNDAPHSYDEMESNTTTTTTSDIPQPKRTKKTKPPHDQDIVDLTR